MIKYSNVRNENQFSDIRKGMRSQSDRLEINALFKPREKSRRIFQSQKQNVLLHNSESHQKIPNLQMIRDKKARLVSEMTDLRTEIINRSKFEGNESRLVEKIFNFLYANYIDLFGFKEIIDKLHSLIFSDSPLHEVFGCHQTYAQHHELPSLPGMRDSYVDNIKLLRDLFGKERGVSNFEKEINNKMNLLVASYSESGRYKTLDAPKIDD